MPEVIVIGGGVIGLTTAYELAGRGMQVTLLDRQQSGKEASWAGAGILPPGRAGDPQHPLATLTAATHELWPSISEELRDETGIDNGFRQCGGLCFSPDGDKAALQGEVDDWSSAGVAVERLTGAELSSLEPAVNERIGPAFRLPGTWQVRNPRHLKALVAACVKRGADIRSGVAVANIFSTDGLVRMIDAGDEELPADIFIVTTGAWTTSLLAGVNVARKIEPVRGQMVLLSTPAPVVRHVIECGPRYIVPREDGLTLVGSTEEWVGFEKRTTPVAIRGLMDFAIRMVPALAEARFERAWSGLRPQSVDALPLIGRVPGVGNLYVAAGHFRAGLHLSPITARLLTQQIIGEPTDLPLDPFDPGRLDGEWS